MSLNHNRKLQLLQASIIAFGLLLTSSISGQPRDSQQIQLTSQDSPIARYRLQVNRLLNLVRQRLIIQNDVARNKWNQNSPIEASQREQQLLIQIRQQAPIYGLNPDAASTFFQWQIFAGKLIQVHNFQDWQTEGVQSFDNVPDLNQVLRPSLDKLTSEILSALAPLTPVLNCSTVQQLVQSRAQIILRGESIDIIVRRVAIAPLIELKGTSCPALSGLNGVKKLNQ